MQRLGELVGQELPARILKRSMAEGRVGHAYLFWGPEGTGKRTAALALAAGLLCQAPRPDGEACGECAACRRVELGIHPDLHLIEPLEGSLRIDQVRELRQAVALKPLEGGRKVVVLDGAETMTGEAGNSLLKTLEEPLGDTVIVLLATQFGRIPETIASRCIQLAFRPLSPSRLAPVLVERRGLPEDRAILVATLAGGRPGRAMALEVEELDRERSAARELVAAVRSAALSDLFGLTETLAAGQASELDEMLELVVWLYRDMLAIAAGAPAQVVNRDLVPWLEEEASRYGVDGLVAAIDRVTAARRHLRERVARRLVLEVCLLGCRAGLRKVGLSA